VPASVIFLSNAQQTGLPVGWTIVSNSGQQLRICNTSDVIEGNTNLSIILKVQGVTIAPATTFQGAMAFAGASCAAAGPAPAGNVTNDDNATSTIEVIAAPVPLTLIDFSSTLKECEPLLNWVTESEINTDKFIIERSNNSNDWEALGEVFANGSGTRTNYSFTDKLLNSTKDKVFYRLKMIDIGGGYKYSTILPMLINCKSKDALIYPNPVLDGKLYVSLVGTTGKVKATLLSTTGQVILMSNLNNGTNFFDVTKVPRAVYIVNIKDDTGFNKNMKVFINY
jgi:hypothetical protein